MNIKFDIQKPINQLAVFLMLIGCCFMLLSAITGIIIHFEKDTTNANRIISLVSQLVVFLLPCLILTIWLQKCGKTDYLRTKTYPQWTDFLLVVLIMTVSIPFLSAVIEWNENIVLPEKMADLEQWMKNMEEQATQITEEMLFTNNWKILLVNVLIIGLLPAICEEVLFRGVVLNWLLEIVKNKHIAIFVSAFLFSFIHFQFYGFVPRMLLGILFAYLVLYSGSLWTSIFAHFLNNSMAVITAYAYYNGYIQTNYEKFGSFEGVWYAIVLSLILTSLALYLFFKKHQSNKKENYHK